jgi:hypothetical protein
MIARGQAVKYAYVPEVLDRLRASYHAENGASEDVVGLYQEPDVLLLDDLGAEKPTAWVAEKIGILVEERYRNDRRLAIATNLSYSNPPTRENPNPWPPGCLEHYGPRLTSRLFDVATGTALGVLMDCPDYRAGAD